MGNVVNEVGVIGVVIENFFVVESQCIDCFGLCCLFVELCIQVKSFFFEWYSDV